MQINLADIKTPIPYLNIILQFPRILIPGMNRVTPKITLPQIVMAPESSGENVKGTSADLVQLLSQESANALVCEEKQPLAWRCEFDINLAESLEVVNPAT